MIAALLLAAALATEPVTVAAGGDVLLGRGVAAYLEAHGAAAVLEGAGRAFAGSDLALVNLEGPLATCPEPASKRFPLHASPRWAPALRAAGVDVVSLANNHALDCGAAGLFEALNVLEKAGIAVAGIEDGGPQRPVVLERRGRRIGILAYSAVDDSAWSARGLRYARLLPESLEELAAVRRGVDLLIVLVHWGREEDPTPLPGQRDWARRIASAGADLVVGHHAHVLQPSERVGRTLVLYGLGNLLFDRSGLAGAVARVELGGGSPGLRLVPIRIEGGRTVSSPIARHGGGGSSRAPSGGCHGAVRRRLPHGAPRFRER